MLDLTPHQRSQLSLATSAAIGILAGSPGTGKTFTAARLIATLQSVAVAAPTGKAAVRIAEIMQSYGVNIQARTIHSLLGVESRSGEDGDRDRGDGWGFRHNSTNPFPFRYIIIDESSMIDTDLMASLLRACGRGTHVLFVGDINQLPPVGHGAPLRDMIAAEVPCGELREIKRQDGSRPNAIIQACADMRDGKRWRTCERVNLSAGDNLKLIPAANGPAAVESIVQLIRKIRDRKLFDPIADVQVICAVNEKSVLSRRALNERLQGELNPAGKRVGSNPFRVGDKIVCLKNGFLPVVDGADSDGETNQELNGDGKVYVANGEQGRVVAVEEKLTTVRLESPKRLVKIPRGKQEGEGDEGQGSDSSGDKPASATGCQWDLAYAISCHKAQGSEFGCIIVVLDDYPGARMVCDRSWIYTAISRAKQVCFLVGKRSTADSMVLRNAVMKRKTFLRELIKGDNEGNGNGNGN